jgi:hypothetical protein
LQDPPKFTQIGIFGLKMYHLATLVRDDFEWKSVFSFDNGPSQWGQFRTTELLRLSQICRVQTWIGNAHSKDTYVRRQKQFIFQMSILRQTLDATRTTYVVNHTYIECEQLCT